MCSPCKACLRFVEAAQAGEAVAVMRLQLFSPSGDAILSSLQLAASGTGDDTRIQNVQLVVDEADNGRVDPEDATIGEGRYDADDGDLRMTLTNPWEVPPGATTLLVVYQF